MLTEANASSAALGMMGNIKTERRCWTGAPGFLMALRAAADNRRWLNNKATRALAEQQANQLMKLQLSLMIANKAPDAGAN